jgi:hypothetical protein
MGILTGRFPRISGTHRGLFVALGAAALFSAESWALGPLSWIYGYGSGLETIPALKALAFDARNFSLWSPFVAGGVDRLAFWGNANPLGPEYLLFSTLPTWLANGLHRFLQYFVAVFFAGRVADEQLGLKGWWASLAGILFGCFSYFTVGALFTLPGVPMMAWLLAHSVGDKGSYRTAIGSAFLLSFATTFTFGVPYLLTFAVLWCSLLQRVRWRRAFGHFTAFAIVLTIATAPQLLAIAANGATSHRAAWKPEPISASIDGLFYRQLQFDLFDQDKTLRLITINLPWLGFLAGLPLAWLGCRRNNGVKRLAGMFLRVALVFSLVSQKWAWLLLQSAVAHFAPFARGVYMGRFFQIPAPFLIALGLTLVVRLAWLLVGEHRAPRWILSGAVGGFIGFMLVEPKVHLFYDLGVNDWGQANYQVRVVDALRTQPGPFRVASVLPLQPAYAYAQGLETADGWANVYPSVYRDLWLRVLTPLFAEIPFNRQVFGVESGRAEDNFILLGTDLVRPGVGLLPGEDVDDGLRNGFNIDRRFNLSLLRLLNVRYLLSEYPLRGTGIRLRHAGDPWPTWPQYRSRNTGLVEGVRRPSTVDFGRVRPLVQPLWDYIQATRRRLHGKDVFVYELTDSLPRFRLVENVLVEASGKAVLDRLSSMDVAALRSTAVLEAADARSIARHLNLASGRIDLAGYQSDCIDLDVTVAGDAFLVIANTWSPFWTARVDGQTETLIRTNHAQYGLPIGPGTHSVTLAYRPPYDFTSMAEIATHVP